MEARSPKVYVVVDRNFGEQLSSLEDGVPVWIVETPRNRPVVEKLRKERQPANHLTGITTFGDQASATSEELFLGQLDTIDLHHGPYSWAVPYSVLEAVGCSLSEDIRSTLREFGFSDFQENLLGFTAKRPKTTDHSHEQDPDRST